MVPILRSDRIPRMADFRFITSGLQIQNLLMCSGMFMRTSGESSNMQSMPRFCACLAFHVAKSSSSSGRTMSV